MGLSRGCDAGRKALDEQLGAGGLHLHHAIKGALDPLGILNPGKVF